MLPAKTTTNASFVLCLAMLLMAIVVTSCQTAPPVQEMSDARQAIAVAREAGAAEHALGSLREAERYLDSAQRNLTERAYVQARRDAVAAKDKALEALSLAEAQAPR